MKSRIDAFCKRVDGKSVALVGNAQSIFDHPYGDEIDRCDEVIRMNKGFVKDREFQGKKTTILATSIPINLETIHSEFDPQLVIWATSKRKHLPQEYYRQPFTFACHPKPTWLRLRLSLGSRPSTGAIIANFLARHCTPEIVNVFGFDHFTSKTFYETRDDIGPHSADGEEVFFNCLYESGLFRDCRK